MPVYRMIPAEGNWQFLVPHGRESRERLYGLPVSAIREGGQPIEVDVVIRDPKRGLLKPSDMPWFASHVPAFTREAADKLKPLLEGAGHVFPLESLYGDFVALDIRCALPALDADASDIRRFPSTGRVMDVERHVFKPEVVADHSIFRLDIFDRAGSAYVTDAYLDAVRGFVRGVEFERVWTP